MKLRQAIQVAVVLLVMNASIAVAWLVYPNKAMGLPRLYLECGITAAGVAILFASMRVWRKWRNRFKP